METPITNDNRVHSFYLGTPISINNNNRVYFVYLGTTITKNKE